MSRWTPVMRSVLRMLLPSSRVERTASFFSVFSVFIGLAFLWRRPFSENDWSSISMAFAGCWGVSHP